MLLTLGSSERCFLCIRIIIACFLGIWCMFAWFHEVLVYYVWQCLTLYVVMAWLGSVEQLVNPQNIVTSIHSQWQKFLAICCGMLDGFSIIGHSLFRCWSIHIDIMNYRLHKSLGTYNVSLKWSVTLEGYLEWTMTKFNKDASITKEPLFNTTNPFLLLL